MRAGIEFILEPQRRRAKTEIYDRGLFQYIAIPTIFEKGRGYLYSLYYCTIILVITHRFRKILKSQRILQREQIGCSSPGSTAVDRSIIQHNDTRIAFPGSSICCIDQLMAGRKRWSYVPRLMVDHTLVPEDLVWQLHDKSRLSLNVHPEQEAKAWPLK